MASLAKKCVMVYSFTVLVFQGVVGVTPNFRILAPEFICPKDDSTPVDKPDNTIITIQTAAGADFVITWTVRWTPLDKPTQRFTLLLWKAVRALEAKLNNHQPVPFVYVIENDELLTGVDYIFKVNAVEPSGEMGAPKTFHIDNSQGNQKLDMIEGRTEQLSVILVGAQVAFADMEFVLEAQVTTCYHTQDYYFLWTVRNIESDENIDVSHITGSRLEVPPNSLKAGQTYNVNCEVIKYSNGYRITQTSLPFQVMHRGLEVYLNIDYLMVTVNHPFFIEAAVANHDYYDSTLTFKWECKHEEKVCDKVASDKETLFFSDGLPKIGQYEVTVTVTVSDQSATASATIVTVQPILPVIQISPLLRTLNEHSTLYLVANASNVAPTCTLTWYFATKEYLSFPVNQTCDDCQHGEALADTLTILSLEENFLNELTDFTNQTEWRQVSAETSAGAGRARFVAQCGCSLTFQCETEGTVHADIQFQLNESPKPGEVMVVPESGVGLETGFRISTFAVVDIDTPLRYTFYCRVGINETLILASYLDHLSVETLLPYVDGDGTEIWVELCDARGACSTSEPMTVPLSAGKTDTIDCLIEDTRAHARRCELLSLRFVAVSAIVTYTNAVLLAALRKFTEAILESLSAIEASCLEKNYEMYSELLQWLASHGVNTSDLINDI